MQKHNDGIITMNTQLPESDQVDILDSITQRIQGFMYRCKNDEDYTMLFMKGKTEEVTGYRHNELINNTQISYVTLIHPEDVNRVDSAVDKGVQEHTNWHIDYRVRCKNGGTVWVNEIGGAVYDNEGQLLYLEGMVLDISAQKQQEDYTQKLESFSEVISKETNNIIYVMETLKLLSINAAIESARQSVAGAAFGIIANEMKALSNKSKQHTETIKDVLEELENTQLLNKSK